MKTSNRWIELIAGIFVLFNLGLIYSWSIFSRPLNHHFGNAWSQGQLALVFTLSMIFFCIGGFLNGLLRKNIKKVLAGSALLISAGFWLISLADTLSIPPLYLLYVCYGVLGGLGIGLAFNSVIANVSQKFKEKQGLASGALLMGFGIGSVFLGSACEKLIAAFGVLPTFRALSIWILINGLIGVIFLHDALTTQAEARLATGLAPKQMLKLPLFGLYFIWVILVSAAGLMVINDAANIALAVNLSGTIGLLMPAFSGIGKLTFGYLYDRLKRSRTMLLGSLFLAVGGFCLAGGSYSGQAVLIILGLIFLGLSYGSGSAITAAFISQYYGSKFYAANYSLATFNLVFSALIGPSLAVQVEVNYGTFYLFLVILLLAALAFVVLLLMKFIETKGEKNRGGEVCGKKDFSN